ncbi:uncharacterized protein LOC122370689 isoform X2 [Amphibalanus amphitrite]|uniref:uncharacterized protein LOC122370689 isoform X2 n=1 Tax=Amphibalanus amphitrite TaxID=1232801 RepID=UPI001C8FA950|nr:uncharacterized protein LOC122370689 isoform X2 [Amphibalanus amphitrite]
MAASTPELILAWLRAQWRAMAEQLDDFICSFDPPVPEGMDALTVVVLGWVVFCAVLALLVHFFKNYKSVQSAGAESVSLQGGSDSELRKNVLLPNNASGKATSAPIVPNSGKSGGLDSVDSSFISRVQSSKPFKEAVANRRRSPSPTRAVKIPYVSGAPVANGEIDDEVLWVNNVINWIYGRAEVRNSISQAWLAALNSHAMKMSKEAGINLHFVNIRPETERAEFSNVVVEHGPDDTMTITADASACPLLTTRVTYEQDGRTRSATYATTVQKLRGRINVAALTHQAMAIGKFDGWPEVQLLLEPTSDSGRSSALEEQIRQEGAREVVTGCLRDAVVDLNFGQEADFPPFVRTEEPERVRSLSRDRPEANGGERMTRRLLVKVVKAAGLGASKGCKEPYCEIEMDEPPQKFQTETRLDTDHPFWDEAFVFDLSPNTSELLFEVFDKQKARDTNFLGLGIVGIEELLVNPSQRQIIPLLSRPYEQDPVSGSLTVEFLFVDEHGAPVEEGGLPHRVTHTSERLLHSGEILQTTRTTYTRPEDVDDGNFVKSMALKDMDLKARPNAKKSTLIIHSSKKEPIALPTVKDNLDDSIQLSDPGSEGQDAARGGAQSASGDEGARGRRRSKKRSLFGTLRRRLGGSKSRSQSTEPGARQDWEDEPGRSASLDRGHYLTVPVPGGGGGTGPPVATAAAGDRRSHPCLSGRPGGPDDSSLSDMSGISNASNRTYVNDQSSLVLETTENGVLKHYLVPNNLAKRGKLRKKGTKLHVFNEHVFVARHLPSALCSVCEKSLPRWLGKQAYECRNCQAKVHKQCHVRVETICPESTVHTMELEYLQTMEDKRQRNMTR